MRIMNCLIKLISAACILVLISILIGEIFSISILNLIGIILLSDSGNLIGVEAIGKQICLKRALYDRKAIETYPGLAAIIQDIIIILLGILLSPISILVYFDIGRSIFLYFVLRTGILLIIIVLYFILTALRPI